MYYLFGPASCERNLLLFLVQLARTRAGVLLVEILKSNVALILPVVVQLFRFEFHGEESLPFRLLEIQSSYVSIALAIEQEPYQNMRAIFVSAVMLSYSHETMELVEMKITHYYQLSTELGGLV